MRREDCDDDLRGKWVVLTNDGRRAVLKAMRDHNKAIREYFFDVLDERSRPCCSGCPTGCWAPSTRRSATRTPRALTPQRG